MKVTANKFLQQQRQKAGTVFTSIFLSRGSAEERHSIALLFNRVRLKILRLASGSVALTIPYNHMPAR